MKRIGRFFLTALDWLYPPVCSGCKRVGFLWCPDCQQQVQLLPEPLCQVCGIPISYPGACPSCSVSRPLYKALRSWAVFEGPIRNSLHSLKYRRNITLGEVLSRQFAVYAATLAWPVDVITSVPLGRERLVERGYNQMALVARPLAQTLRKPYSDKLLSRSKETHSQVGLSPVERKQNVAGAFQADVRFTADRSVLVIDDVATTGATLASCTEALLSAGAREVYALTLARALPHHGFQIV